MLLTLFSDVRMFVSIQRGFLPPFSQKKMKRPLFVARCKLIMGKWVVNMLHPSVKRTLYGNSDGKKPSYFNISMLSINRCYASTYPTRTWGKWHLLPQQLTLKCWWFKLQVILSNDKMIENLHFAQDPCSDYEYARTVTTVTSV